MRQLYVNLTADDCTTPSLRLFNVVGDRGLRFNGTGDCLNTFNLRYINPTEGEGKENNPEKMEYSLNNNPGPAYWHEHDVRHNSRWNQAHVSE